MHLAQDKVLEDIKERSSFREDGEFYVMLSDYQLLRKACPLS
jgi:hypothetical protein